jgi:hypothetical protein
MYFCSHSISFQTCQEIEYISFAISSCTNDSLSNSTAASCLSAVEAASKTNPIAITQNIALCFDLRYLYHLLLCARHVQLAGGMTDVGL